MSDQPNTTPIRAAWGAVYLVLWTVGEIGTILAVLALPSIGPVPLLLFGCVWGVAFWMADIDAKRYAARLRSAR